MIKAACTSQLVLTDKTEIECKFPEARDPAKKISSQRVSEFAISVLGFPRAQGVQ
jgi:hypothetical protein